MMVRLWAMVLLAGGLAGCTSGYGSGYDYYPGETYYYDDPYYGGGFGYGSYHHYFDRDHYHRYFHPADNVSCDRVRDICYDRFGPSYHATARYLGESEANQAYKKYGNSVFLFSPRPGVSCDRRTRECSDGQWPGARRAASDPLKRLEPGNIGSIGSGSRFEDDDESVRRVAPVRRSNDDDAIARPKAPRVEARPPRLADNDDDRARPPRRVQSEQPTVRPRLNSGDKVRDGGAGNACPPLGCK
jgi:hypothetical protein